MENHESTPISWRIKGNGGFSMKFPVPPSLAPSTKIAELKSQSIDYYLLARYSYIHHMDYAYMINSFWAVEYIILAILSVRHPDRSSLLASHKPHAIPSYWKEAKSIINDPNILMEEFDGFVSEMAGFYNHRYPTGYQDAEIVISDSKVSVYSEGESKPLKFSSHAKISIEKIDEFMSFMLHDVIPLSSDPSVYFGEFLAATDNYQTYIADNKFTFSYPNKKL